MEKNISIEIERYKKSLRGRNEDDAMAALSSICIHINSYIIEGKKYSLRNILFQSGCIKNPLGRYDKEDYKFANHVFYQVLNTVQNANNMVIESFESTDDTKSFFDESIITDLCCLFVYNECFYYMNQINSKRIENNAIFKKSFITKIMMMILFHQDQVRLLKSDFEGYINDGNITGAELEIAKNTHTYAGEYKVSVNDNLESTLESIDEMLRYFMYMHKKDFPERISEQDIEYSEIRPYFNGDFEKMMCIGHQRYGLKRTEEGVRYGYLMPNYCGKNELGIKEFFFSICDTQYRNHILGVRRRIIQTRQNVLKIYNAKDMLEKSDVAISKLANELKSIQDSKSKMIDFSTFHPDEKLFKQGTQIAEINIINAKVFIKEYYFKLTAGGLTISELFLGYSYLLTLSEILFKVAIDIIDEEDQSTFIKEIAIVDIAYLCEELSRIYHVDKDKSYTIIDRFIFHEKDNRYDDIFSQPLIKLSENQVLLCESLLDQIYLERIVERQFIRYKVDTSYMGKFFEDKVKSKLAEGYSPGLLKKRKTIPGFQLNTNKIEYMAFDGRQIEFDVVAKLKDFLLLIELKSIMKSYDLDELSAHGKNVDKAVEQLERRAESVQKDWDKFKQAVSFDVPESPYDKEHIILIACSDAYDYTPCKVDDVYITDDSTLLKYLTNPYVDYLKVGKTNNIGQIKSLWAVGEPNPKELKKYLMNPVTTSYISKVLSKELMPLEVFDEDDYLLVCEDYRMISDPIVNELNTLKHGGKSAKKIYPNEKCPCGSGKKYKMCCGRKD